MSDPDGLTEEQRVLVNAAHQAIVITAGLSAIESAPTPDGDEGYDLAEARQRSRAALAAAEAAGVPRDVLVRMVRSAIATGREAAGA